MQVKVLPGDRSREALRVTLNTLFGKVLEEGDEVLQTGVTIERAYKLAERSDGEGPGFGYVVCFFTDFSARERVIPRAWAPAISWEQRLRFCLSSRGHFT